MSKTTEREKKGERERERERVCVCECGEGAPGQRPRKKRRGKKLPRPAQRHGLSALQPGGGGRVRGGASTGRARPWFRRNLSDSFGLENSGCRSSRVRSMVPLFKQSLGHGLKMKKSEKAQLHTLKYHIRDSTLLHNPSSGRMGSGVLHAYLYSNTHYNIGVYGIHMMYNSVCMCVLSSNGIRRDPTRFQCRHGIIVLPRTLLSLVYKCRSRKGARCGVHSRYNLV